MRNVRYSILPSIRDGIEHAQQGKLNLYWQRDIEREYRCKRVSAEEQQAYSDLKKILEDVPQWSDVEAAYDEVGKIGGKILFCRYFEEHYSMAELVQDSHGMYYIAYVLDSDITPEERKAAAQEVQQLLSEKMNEWNIVRRETPVPEEMKYSSLDEAASALMDVFDHPEEISG